MGLNKHYRTENISPPTNQYFKKRPWLRDREYGSQKAVRPNKSHHINKANTAFQHP